MSMEQTMFRIATKSDFYSNQYSLDFNLQPEIFHFEINNSIEAEHFGMKASERFGKTFYGEHKTNQLSQQFAIC